MDFEFLSTVFLLFFVVVGFFVLVVFPIWMLIDSLMRKFPDNIEKLIWVLVIIFVNFIGALIYFFAVKVRKKTP